MPKKDFTNNPALAYIANTPDDSVEDVPNKDTEAIVGEIVEEIPKTGKGYEYRFNLNTTRDIKEYLDLIDKLKKGSRTEHINMLIRNDMEQNGEKLKMMAEKFEAIEAEFKEMTSGTLDT